MILTLDTPPPAENADSLCINEKVFQKIPEEVITYLNVDSVKEGNDDEGTVYSPEFFNTLAPSGMPPHRLNLKREAIVMLLRNLSLQQVLYNDARLKVTNLHKSCI